MQKTSSKLLTPYDEITHTFTTRFGGVSLPPYNSLNLAFHVGDKPENVRENHKTLAIEMGYERSKLVHMQQIHSDKIVVIDPEIHNFKNPPQCDALITNKKGIPLMVMVADCTPVLFYDPVQQVIAVAHAGRAGALQGIVPKTIQKMQQHFKSTLEDIKVVLGPSIGACCYEVNEEIFKNVKSKGYGLSTVFEKRRYYLDVKSIIHQQLKTLGLDRSQVEDLDICNACKSDIYFSYRADQQKSGRFAGVIMLT